MKRTYLLVDMANMFWRARHSASRQADSWERIGFAIHATLNSINKAWRLSNADHVVIALEGRSWRKDFYDPYKKNRDAKRAQLSKKEIEEDVEFYEAHSQLMEFFDESTNCTIIQSPIAEADDVIARWIALHPDDDHVIVSSDTDFVQLVAPNVKQYNGISGEIITADGIFDDLNRRVKDKKTMKHKEVPNPDWLLFEKCIRGDATDNIFSAYPGVRKKGSKNRVGLIEAFEDRNTRGYSWNNLMLQRWIDHNNVEHRVLDDYERNVTLIDLTAQPEDIKKQIDKDISERMIKKNISMIGLRFLKFCGKFELNQLSNQPDRIVSWAAAAYV